MARCPRCDGNGAVTVRYRSGEPFDLGICTCPTADILRRLFATCPDRVATHYGVPVDRIGLVDEWLDSTEGEPTASDDDAVLINAGKVIKAGLGGKVQR